MGFNKVSDQNADRKHYSVKMIIEKIGKTQWESSYKFAFVRNPWARVVSLYQFQKFHFERGSQLNVFFKRSQNNSFNDWVRHFYSTNNHESRNILNKLTQKQWLVDDTGKVDLNFIGRYETLETDFIYLSKLFKTKWNLQKKNTSPLSSDNYHTWYNSDSRKLVSNYFHEDIDYFKYTY